MLSYPKFLASVLDAQERLIETVLLSTQKICFGGEIRIFFRYALLAVVIIHCQLAYTYVFPGYK